MNEKSYRRNNLDVYQFKIKGDSFTISNHSIIYRGYNKTWKDDSRRIPRSLIIDWENIVQIIIRTELTKESYKWGRGTIQTTLSFKTKSDDKSLELWHRKLNKSLKLEKEIDDFISILKNYAESRGKKLILTQLAMESIKSENKESENKLLIAIKNKQLKIEELKNKNKNENGIFNEKLEDEIKSLSKEMNLLKVIYLKTYYNREKEKIMSITSTFIIFLTVGISILFFTSLYLSIIYKSPIISEFFFISLFIIMVILVTLLRIKRIRKERQELKEKTLEIQKRTNNIKI